MVRRCRNCRKEISESAVYCPSCGVPSEASRLDKVETVYRHKLVAVSWWEMWSQLVKGLIKMMPAILIVNGILLVGNWTIGEPWDNQVDAARVALATFFAFSWLLAFAILCSESIESNLTKHQRHAAILASEVAAYRTMANEYFKKFCNEGIAEVAYKELRPNKLAANGAIDELVIRSKWQTSTPISLERQKDMRHADWDLTRMMDNLDTLTGEFIADFNKFSSVVAPHVDRILATYTSRYSPDSVRKAGTLGMYWCLSGVISDSSTLSEWAMKGFITEDVKEFVEILLKHIDADNFNIDDDSLKEALETATKAKKAQDVAIAHRDELRIMLEAKKYMTFS